MATITSPIIKNAFTLKLSDDEMDTVTEIAVRREASVAEVLVASFEAGFICFRDNLKCSRHKD